MMTGCLKMFDKLKCNCHDISYVGGNGMQITYFEIAVS
jgi:hypothetical protein